jgi:protein-tyrosine phosphatase
MICHGNIYRSPLAAALLAARRPDLEVSSAGFHHRPDRSTPEEFAELVRSLGVDMTPHRSRVVTRGLLDAAQLVVIMDRRNAVSLRTLGDHHRVLWLGALVGNAEIADPYCAAPAVQERIARELDMATRQLAKALPTV